MSGTRVAVVTGSNKGLGLSIVKNLCSNFDGDVYLTSRNAARGAEAVEELNKLGLNPKFHELDIDDEASVLKLRDYLKATYGGLDVLVNNAAIAFFNADFGCTVEESVATLRTNFFSTHRACNILFPILRPHARVVNISSCLGHLSMIRGTGKAAMELKEKLSSRNLTEEELCQMMQNYVNAVKRGDEGIYGWPTLVTPSYIVSKIGVSALTRIQQRQFDQDSREDIVVNSIHPGYIQTDMSGKMGDKTPDQAAVAPSWLATLPENVEAPKGDYVWFSKRIVDWIHGPMPECSGLTMLNPIIDTKESSQ